MTYRFVVRSLPSGKLDRGTISCKTPWSEEQIERFKRNVEEEGAKIVEFYEEVAQ